MCDMSRLQTVLIAFMWQSNKQYKESVFILWHLRPEEPLGAGAGAGVGFHGSENSLWLSACGGRRWPGWFDCEAGQAVWIETSAGTEQSGVLQASQGKK